MKQYMFTHEYNGKVYDVYAVKTGTGWDLTTKESRELTGKDLEMYFKYVKKEK